MAGDRSVDAWLLQGEQGVTRPDDGRLGRLCGLVARVSPKSKLVSENVVGGDTDAAAVTAAAHRLPAARRDPAPLQHDCCDTRVVRLSPARQCKT